ncbi:MAG: response regulator receiver protein [Chloroflexi bacterium OLB14]|nr:MAG: response regulator receiver protein [Chloroflexi bacterium OLB14]
MPNKILVVDADSASRGFIVQKLLGQNNEVIEAGSGKEGLILAWRDRPELIIADPTMTDLRGEDFAKKLKNDARTAQVPLIALSSDSNPERIKACLKMGFNEYITKSGQAVPLLMSTIQRLLELDENAMKQGGKLIVFLSAKGGTGTSSLCANLALNLADVEPSARVAVADFVLPIGSIAPIVGYDGSVNIVHVADQLHRIVSAQSSLNQLPEMRDWKFNLLAGSPDPEMSNLLKVEHMWDIVTSLKQAYDYVLIDIGRSLSKITLPLIQHADLVTLLISTDTSTLSLTKILLDYLKNKGVQEDSIYTILNRAAGLEGLSKAEAQSKLGITINATIPYLNTNLAFANSQHQPFTSKFPHDTAGVIFREIAKDMVGKREKLAVT